MRTPSVWKEITKRKPPIEQEVIVTYEGKYHLIAEMYFERGHYYFETDKGKRSLDEFTHWMHIPPVFMEYGEDEI